MPPDFSHLPPDRRAEAETIFARMMAALPYERDIIDGANAVDEWNRLRAIGRGSPIVIGDVESLERIAEQYSIADPSIFGAMPGIPAPLSTSAILGKATKIEFPKNLEQWPGASRAEDLRAEIGAWPTTSGGQPSEPLMSVIFDLARGEAHDRVHVLFVPTMQSWQVPAYLRWGDWNACPPPEFHVAALRHWHQAYGAELAGINGDRMDVWVPRPPESRDQALSVAKEIYQYCPDIVDQGTGTLAALAATMVTTHWWNFWWD